jgi:transposase-like protein
MAEPTQRRDVFDVECPHCHRRFSAELLGPTSPRQAGFKCPHCKLFVAYERISESPPNNNSPAAG